MSMILYLSKLKINRSLFTDLVYTDHFLLVKEKCMEVLQKYVHPKYT